MSTLYYNITYSGWIMKIHMILIKQNKILLTKHFFKLFVYYKCHLQHTFLFTNISLKVYRYQHATSKFVLV